MSECAICGKPTSYFLMASKEKPKEKWICRSCCEAITYMQNEVWSEELDAARAGV